MSDDAMPLSSAMVDVLRSLASHTGMRADDVPGRSRRSLAALCDRGFAIDVPGGYIITSPGRIALEAHDRIFRAAKAA